jgi:hypothetical protein
MRARRLATVAGLLVACAASSVAAAERDFAFSWTTHVLERGRDDLEVWVTPRLARTADFSLVDTRFVWTHGVVRNLESQVSLDLAFQNTDQDHSVDPRVTSLWRWAPWRADGLVGLGLVGRASLGPDVVELEARLIADKQLGDVLLAANALFSQAFFWNGRTGIDTRLEESLSVAYVVAPFVRLGLELRAKSSFQRGDYQGTAFYVGPSLAFRFKPVWFTLGAVAQVAADQAKEDQGTSEPLTLRDDERFVLRLTFGFPTD